MKKILFIISILIFSLSAQQTLAASYTVSTTEDELDGSPSCETGSSTDCSLREAISEANSNNGDDTIVVPAGTYLLDIGSTDEDANADGDLDVTDAGDRLTISGDGIGSTIIDGNNTERVFSVTGSTVELEINDATLQNGNDDNGGGVYVNGTLELVSTEIKNCTATSDSGAVHLMIGSTLTAADSVFNNNEATGDDGGAIYNRGSFTISNSLFINNTAADDGGAVISYNSDTTNTITNSTFYNNEATSQGGAVLSKANSGGTTSDTINLKHVTIYGNKAAGGGGLFATSQVDDIATINVYNSIIYDNTGSGSPEDCLVTNGYITSQDYNLETGTDCGFTETNDLQSTNPGLGTLEDNGGDTNTFDFSDYSSSPAVDVIPSATCESVLGASPTDQRGYDRPENTNCDIGAYEADQTDPTVLVTSGTDTIECSVDTWIDAGATATDNFASGLTASTTDTVTEETVGSYEITYTSTEDYDGNTDTDSRTVTVQDTTNPSISITNNTSQYNTLECGVDTWSDPGATASDVCSVSATPSATGTVDEDTIGTYTVSYNVSDDESNPATQQQRTVTVQDTTDPVISITGETSVTIAEGETYTDAGATAADACEGSLSVNTSNSVDTNTPGTYTVTYSVEDSEGNSDTATRTVTVTAAPEESPDDTPQEDTDTDDDGIPDTIEDLDPTDTDVVAANLVDVNGTSEGRIIVTYSDETTATITVFASSTSSDDVKLVQIDDTAYVAVVHAKGKKLATVNVFTGEIIDSKKLAKKKYTTVGTPKKITARKTDFIVTTLKNNKNKVHLAITKLKSDYTLGKKNAETFKSKNLKVKNTKQHKKNFLQVRKKNGKVIRKYKITKKYKLKLQN